MERTPPPKKKKEVKPDFHQNSTVRISFPICTCAKPTDVQKIERGTTNYAKRESDIHNQRSETETKAEIQEWKPKQPT